MKVIINKDGKRRHFYTKGDVVVNIVDGTVYTVDSVLGKEGKFIDVRGNIVPLTSDIKPTKETNDRAVVVDNSVKVLGDGIVYFAKTKPNAVIPTKDAENCGYDIYTCETDTIVIPPCSTRIIETGVAIACSHDYFPKFFDKSSFGALGMVVLGGVGDASYRNSYKIPLCNTNAHKFFIMTNQPIEYVEKCTIFDVELNQFLNLEEMSEEELAKERRFLYAKDCIVKPINKAFCQFVMLPVPNLSPKNLTWEELQAIPSKRGLLGFGQGTGK